MNITFSKSALGLIAGSSLFTFSQAAEARQCRRADTAGEYGPEMSVFLVKSFVLPGIG